MSQDIPIDEQIAEAERELHTRLSVYPRRVSNGKMTQAKADRSLAIQRAIIETLRGVAVDHPEFPIAPGGQPGTASA